MCRPVTYQRSVPPKLLLALERGSPKGNGIIATRNVNGLGVVNPHSIPHNSLIILQDLVFWPQLVHFVLICLHLST